MPDITPAPVDASRTGSPGWWMKRLLGQLAERTPDLNLLESYYRGDPPMPWGPDNCRPAFQRFQRKARANWAKLIVEAPRERMLPVGFRTGAVEDDLGDEAAWRIWQANGLDAGHKLVHRAKMTMRDAYVIVGGRDPDIGAPLITPEDPRQVITAHDPVNPRRVIAALKVFADDVQGLDLAYLYLPGAGQGRGRVLRARRTRPAQGADPGTVTPDVSGWQWFSVDALPTRRVPVVRFGNQMDLYGRSMGEFEDVIDDLDRINLMLLQRLTVAVMQAFKQRAIKGDLPDRDAEGEEIDYDDLFRSDPGAIWRLPEGAEMWESGNLDLTPLLESVKADVRDVAASTRTPMFYLFPDAANGSAEGASLQREGLVFKTRDRIVEASDPWEEVMSLAFEADGDMERAQRSDMEILWQDPERFSLAERYDAAVKAKAADVPWRTRMSEILQMTPQEIQRAEADRAAEAFLTTGDADAPAG